MKYIIVLIILSLLLAGCSHKPTYLETLEQWQAERDNTAYQELLAQYNQVNTELAEAKAQSNKLEGINSQLTIENQTLRQKYGELENKASQSAPKSEIMQLSQAMYQQSLKYNELENKYTTLMNMWKKLESNYSRLAATLKVAINTGNFTDNQTLEYLDVIVSP